MKQKVEILLTPEKENEIEEMLNDIEAIIKREKSPAAVKLPYCKSCNYYNFCWC